GAPGCNAQMRLILMSLGISTVRLHRSLDLSLSARKVPVVPLGTCLRVVSFSERVNELEQFGCGRNYSWIGLHRRECPARPKRAIGRSQPSICESKIRIQFDRPVEISDAFLQLLRCKLAHVVAALPIFLLSLSTLSVVLSYLLLFSAAQPKPQLSCYVS